MAGIYIHIPYCRQACHYCSFHFSTTLKSKSELVKAINWELKKRQKMLDTEVSSIYLGGGTPSILSDRELTSIFKTISQYFSIQKEAEITIETNPEDITRDKLKLYCDLGINRVSVGIQSFLDKDLSYMNRCHNASQSYQALELLKNSEIQNITADLMFGLIDSTLEDTSFNLNQILQFDLPHLSVYNLTIEEQTVFANWKMKQKLQEVPTDEQRRQFYHISESLQDQSYEHYEISNFAKPGARAIHNTNYWKRKDYLGIGPSAHSLKNDMRSWNVANNAKYIKMHQENELQSEVEYLKDEDIYNETIMLGLRTEKGIAIKDIEALPKFLQKYFWTSIKDLEEKKILISDNYRILLHRDYWYICDNISSDLFYTRSQAD